MKKHFPPIVSNLIGVNLLLHPGPCSIQSRHTAQRRFHNGPRGIFSLKNQEPQTAPNGTFTTAGILVPSQRACSPPRCPNLRVHPSLKNHVKNSETLKRSASSTRDSDANENCSDSERRTDLLGETGRARKAEGHHARFRRGGSVPENCIGI